MQRNVDRFWQKKQGGIIIPPCFYEEIQRFQFMKTDIQLRKPFVSYCINIQFENSLGNSCFGIQPCKRFFF